mmetsp:Transcript_13759/g.19838  ORF Transcript_13759/g.19838 Transcript_13759/m.19838 type:complete len:87 (+) Transcript_13759:184-444(+)
MILPATTALAKMTVKLFECGINLYLPTSCTIEMTLCGPLLSCKEEQACTPARQIPLDFLPKAKMAYLVCQLKIKENEYDRYVLEIL